VKSKRKSVGEERSYSSASGAHPCRPREWGSRHITPSGGKGNLKALLLIERLERKQYYFREKDGSGERKRRGEDRRYKEKKNVKKRTLRCVGRKKEIKEKKKKPVRGERGEVRG